MSLRSTTSATLEHKYWTCINNTDFTRVPLTDLRTEGGSCLLLQSILRGVKTSALKNGLPPLTFILKVVPHSPKNQKITAIFEGTLVENPPKIEIQTNLNARLLSLAIKDAFIKQEKVPPQHQLTTAQPDRKNSLYRHQFQLQHVENARLTLCLRQIDLSSLDFTRLHLEEGLRETFRATFEAINSHANTFGMPIIQYTFASCLKHEYIQTTASNPFGNTLFNPETLCIYTPHLTEEQLRLILKKANSQNELNLPSYRLVTQPYAGQFKHTFQTEDSDRDREWACIENADYSQVPNPNFGNAQLLKSFFESLFSSINENSVRCNLPHFEPRIQILPTPPNAEPDYLDDEFDFTHVPMLPQIKIVIETRLTGMQLHEMFDRSLKGRKIVLPKYTFSTSLTDPQQSNRNVHLFDTQGSVTKPKEAEPSAKIPPDSLSEKVVRFTTGVTNLARDWLD